MLFKGVKRNGLYILCGQYHQMNVNSAFISTNISTTEKWHLRMGHIGQTGISYLKQQGYLGNDNVSDLDFCETCVIGKQHGLSFPKRTHLSVGCLDYLHADLWVLKESKHMGGIVIF